MKKLILATLALLAFAGASSAVVGADCPPGKMCIMSGGDEPVSNNSTNDGNQSLEDPRVELTQISSSCSNGGNDTVSWGDYSKMESYPPQHSLEFNGTIITPNPCQELKYNISKEGGIYTMNIYPESKEGVCIECVGAVKYSVDFRATAEYFQLNVQHDGEDVNSFAPPQKINEGGLAEPGQKEQTRTGFLAGILEFFQNLF